MKITNNAIVSIRYKMHNSKGEVLEDMLDGSPVEYMHGRGNILPQLENDLLGLTNGDKKRIMISKNAGFAGVDDDFYFDVVVDAVREATMEEITTGYPHKDKVQACGPGCNC